MKLFVSDIAEAVELGLHRQAREDDLAQEVYSIDSLDELALHPLIQQSLLAAGLGVWPEQRYPGHWHKSRKNEGIRCDLVLTQQQLPLRDPDIKGTLFDNGLAQDPQDAYWLEIKTVAQFEAGEPFQRYAGELLTTVARDVKKIWQDAVICHGGLMLILFTASENVAEHDLFAWHNRCIDRGLPVAAPTVRGFPINNRIGNEWCAVAVFSVRGC